MVHYCTVVVLAGNRHGFIAPVFKSVFRNLFCMVVYVCYLTQYTTVV